MFLILINSDSWWYGEYDVYGGVWMWEDNHELLAQRFPHGLQWLHDTLGMPFACHMGKWYEIDYVSKLND